MKVKHSNKKDTKRFKKKHTSQMAHVFFLTRKKHSLGWVVCRKGLAILAFVKCFNIVFYDSKSPFFTTIGGIPSWELTYPIKNHVWRWFSFCQGGIFLYVSSRKGGYFVSLNHHPLGIFCRNLSQWIEAKTFDSTPVVDSWGKKKRGGTNVSPTGNPKGIRFDLWM